jgi:hypothetical protein
MEPQTASPRSEQACNVERHRSNVHVQVQCDLVAGTQVACTAQLLEGTAEVEVCWDFKVTCDSGASLTAPRSCVHVAPGGTMRTTIPHDKPTMQGTCTGERRAEVVGLTVDVIRRGHGRRPTRSIRQRVARRYSELAATSVG